MMQSEGMAYSGASPLKVVALGLMVAVGLLMSPAMAFGEEEPTEADGLEKLRTANDAFDDEDFDTAYEYYVKAHEILGESMIKYRMGQTAEKTDRVERAIKHYEAYREVGDDEEFLGRIDDALPELRERAVVTVELTTDPEGAMVTIIDDETEEELGESPQTVERVPGAFEVKFELEDYATKRVEKEAGAGDELAVEVELAEADAEEIAELEDLQDVDVDDGPAFGVWGFSSAGVGVGLLALGGVMTFFQMDATNEVNELDRGTHEAASPDEWQQVRQQQQDLRDDANNYHRIAMSAYVAGGVLTAAGLGLVVFDMVGGGDEQPAAQVGVNGGVGPGGGMVTIDGRF